MGSNVARAIAELANLPANWDSYGAPRIESRACAAAENLVNDLQSRLGSRFVEPIVGPDLGGGVELLWETPGDDVEVHVGVPPVGAYTIVILHPPQPARRLVARVPAEVIDALNKSQVLR